jgi:hypothetical protein
MNYVDLVHVLLSRNFGRHIEGSSPFVLHLITVNEIMESRFTAADTLAMGWTTEGSTFESR